MVFLHGNRMPSSDTTFRFSRKVSRPFRTCLKEGLGNRVCVCDNGGRWLSLVCVWDLGPNDATLYVVGDCAAAADRPGTGRVRVQAALHAKSMSVRSGTDTPEVTVPFWTDGRRVDGDSWQDGDPFEFAASPGLSGALSNATRIFWRQ